MQHLGQQWAALNASAAAGMALHGVSTCQGAAFAPGQAARQQQLLGAPGSAPYPPGAAAAAGATFNSWLLPQVQQQQQQQFYAPNPGMGACALQPMAAAAAAAATNNFVSFGQPPLPDQGVTGRNHPALTLQGSSSFSAHAAAGYPLVCNPATMQYMGVPYMPQLVVEPQHQLAAVAAAAAQAAAAAMQIAAAAAHNAAEHAYEPAAAAAVGGPDGAESAAAAVDNHAGEPRKGPQEMRQMCVRGLHALLGDSTEAVWNTYIRDARGKKFNQATCEAFFTEVLGPKGDTIPRMWPQEIVDELQARSSRGCYNYLARKHAACLAD